MHTAALISLSDGQTLNVWFLLCNCFRLARGAKRICHCILPNSYIAFLTILITLFKSLDAFDDFFFFCYLETCKPSKIFQARPIIRFKFLLFNLLVYGTPAPVSFPLKLKIKTWAINIFNSISINIKVCKFNKF